MRLRPPEGIRFVRSEVIVGEDCLGVRGERLVLEPEPLPFGKRREKVISRESGGDAASLGGTRSRETVRDVS